MSVLNVAIRYPQLVSIAFGLSMALALGLLKVSVVAAIPAFALAAILLGWRWTLAAHAGRRRAAPPS
jgi:hypothetical protein